MSHVLTRLYKAIMYLFADSPSKFVELSTLKYHVALDLEVSVEFLSEFRVLLSVVILKVSTLSMSVLRQ